MPASSPAPPLRVVGTGMGVVSPLGQGLEETTRALREGRDGVRPVTTFDVSKTRCKTAGQVVGMRNAECGTRNGKRLHRASHMMIAAAQELWQSDSSFQPELLVIGTTSGGMSFGEAFFRAQVEKRRPRERAAWLANYLPHKPVLDA